MSREAQLIPIYLWVSLSSLVHLGAFEATSSFAPALRRRPASAQVARRPAPIELEFEPVARRAPPAVVTPPPPVPEPRVTTPPPRPPRQRLTPLVAVRPPPAPRPAPRPAPTEPTPALQPPPPRVVRAPVQFVHQENPNQEEAPRDPHYLAQSNRNVEEETIARVRNLNQDSANPQTGGRRHREPTPGEGNGARDVSADSRDLAGDPEHVPHETPRPPRRQAQGPTASLRPSGGGDGRRAGAAGTQGGTAATVGTGQSPSLRPVLTAMGAEGEPGTRGPGSTPGGRGAQGTHQGDGTGGQGGEQGRGATRGNGLGLQGVGASRALQALSPDSAVFAAVYGPQEVERMRRMAQQRRSQARGSYADDWRQTRAAIENFTPRVRVGNQTALRTAASPFAVYLTAMHRRIHRLFADGFLASLDALPSGSPLNDEDLNVTLEIVLERDGSVHRVGIARTSGQLPFDVAALNSVRRSAPFGDAPQAILSGDGRVYLHWGFYRNDRQCGTFNVEPYILPGPGRDAPTPSRPPSGPSPGEERLPFGATRVGSALPPRRTRSTS